MHRDNLLKYRDHLSVPTYIFDEDVLVMRIKEISKRLNGNAGLCYAMKANPFLIKTLEPYVDHFEVCSPGEFKICEQQEISMNKIILSGVYKHEGDVDYVVDNYGEIIIYTAESLHHWDMLDKAARKYQKHLKVLLRLSSGNQFGMDAQDIITICENLSQYPNLEIDGIHYFVGTQRRSTGKYAKDFVKLYDFIQSLPNVDTNKLDIEYGPGLPIDYFAEDKAIEESMENALYEALEEREFPGKITVEMGRYIAASCGQYITQVVDLKHTKDEAYCILDGGMHQVNYFGQSMAMKTPSLYHLEEREGDTDLWNLCGALCTTSDILVKHFEAQGLQLGDHLVFNRVGAYSVTEGIALFLSRDLPQVLLYSQEKGLRVIRKHQELYLLNTREGEN